MGERRKPALGQYGELIVDQACTMAQEWLAEGTANATHWRTTLMVKEV